MRVKFSFYFLLLSGSLCNAVNADSYQLNDNGVSFKPAADVKIVYGMPATNPPSELWVYKVQPATFSSYLVSNLLKITGLTVSNRVRSNSILLEQDKEWVRFETNNEFGQPLGMLDFEPEHGLISYSSSVAAFPLKEAASEKETKELGYKFISMLGITNYNKRPRMMTVNTESFKDQTNVVTSRGVGLSRVIDGIDERGTCLYANFGNGSKVLHFDILYRNLVRDELVKIAATNDVIRFIREGKARAIIQEGNGDYELIPAATKLTITKFQPKYYSVPGMEKLDYEFPFVELSLVADCGTNKVTFYMDCPLIDESRLEVK